MCFPGNSKVVIDGGEMEKRWSSSPRIGLLFVEYVNGDELFDITRGVTHKEIHFSPSFDPDDLKK